MTQKDKVKELVGRGLNSYHTKALQQMNRIEKKNKEQNHKISILSNELDNDYLTKTEEGSVVSLEHSKEGMVYLDELQGNTLVNYCTDGSKEMTLNGDIDVEGTFVTTTEGVDNGLVDVMCEGNTLVNLANIKSIYENANLTSYYADGTICETSLLKLNTAYTLIIEKEFLDGHNMNYRGFELGVGDSINVTNTHPTMTNGSHSMSYNTDKYETKIVTVSFADFKGYKYLTIRPCRRNTAPVKGEVGKYKVKIIFLEGDWTNKEIPQHFEGMKSVGQDDENGHKIEILSRNKNYFNGERKYELNTVRDINITNCVSDLIGKTTRKVTFKADITTINHMGIEGQNSHWGLDINFKFTDGTSAWNDFTKSGGLRELGSNDTKRKFVWVKDFGKEVTIQSMENCKIFTRNSVGTFIMENIEIILGEDTSSQYIPYSLNKKEILMNEPLRGIDNFKDRLVKIGGKWFTERNTEESIFNGDDELYLIHSTNFSDDEYICFYYQIRKAIKNYTNNCVCDKLTCIPDIWNEKKEGIFFQSNIGNMYELVWIKIKKSRLTQSNLNGIKQWLRQNNLKVVYPTTTPIYEPLEIEPTLNTYNDITHISNNSIIPCNMKIQNSGYNAIIKPSTLYTIALDTDKAGTIGMDLGGAKGTTTNNVLKLTTPATLTDDSLRLYGKGIKGSKVRILEGDKTNWIPSFFEGMKSSFEDKVQEDGSYKMEILSNNENLFDYNNLILKNENGCYTTEKLSNGFKIKTPQNPLHHWRVAVEIPIRVKLNTNYTFSLNKSAIKNAYEGMTPIWGVGYMWVKGAKDRTLMERNILDNRRNVFSFNSGNNDIIYIRFNATTDLPVKEGEYDFTDIMLVEGNSNIDYTEQTSNKIQFSSIEPLRGVGDYKDKFVFRNDKLMIQRNCKVTVLDETYNYSIWGNANQAGYFTCHANNYIQGDFNFNPRNTASKEFTISNRTGEIQTISYYKSNPHITVRTTIANSVNEFKNWVKDNNIHLLHPIIEPTYEEIPYELQKIILEGYENGTLFFDTNIPPVATVRYAGETPIVKATKLNKTEVLNNTNDINDNIIPYLMDMDYRVVCLQLQSEEFNDGVAMARLFGGTYEMIKRDILSKRLTREEYGYRLADYFNAGKLTEEQVRELEELR